MWSDSVNPMLQSHCVTAAWPLCRKHRRKTNCGVYVVTSVKWRHFIHLCWCEHNMRWLNVNSVYFQAPHSLLTLEKKKNLYFELKWDIKTGKKMLLYAQIRFSMLTLIQLWRFSTFQHHKHLHFGNIHTFSSRLLTCWWGRNILKCPNSIYCCILPRYTLQMHQTFHSWKTNGILTADCFVLKSILKKNKTLTVSYQCNILL